MQDTALADDITQRVFSNAWAARVSFDPERANASTWIYTIANRLIIDVVARRMTTLSVYPLLEVTGANTLRS